MIKRSYIMFRSVAERVTPDGVPGALVLKTMLLGLVWFATPFWFFVLVAIGAYFFPFFSPGRTAVPFCATLILAGFLPAGLLGTLVVITLMFVIFGVKDLVIIERERAYLFYCFLYLFTWLLLYFRAFEDGPRPVALFWLLAGSGLFLAILSRLAPGTSLGVRAGFEGETIAFLVVSFLLLEGGAVALFLPLNFLYQTAFLFLFTALGIVMTVEAGRRALTRKRVLRYFSLFFVVLILAFASAPWGV